MILLALSMILLTEVMLNYQFPEGHSKHSLDNQQHPHSFDDNNIELSDSAEEFIARYLNQKKLSEADIFNMVETDTNLALDYTRRWDKFHSNGKWPGHKLKTCAHKPTNFQFIKFSAKYWQHLVLSPDLNLYLYNAYYDKRKDTKKVRIIASSDYFNELVNTTLW